MQWSSTGSFYGAARQPPDLMHYGIKGQKWGVRRFQNLDRSYTEEGKIRYGRKSEGGSSLSNAQKRGKATRGLTGGLNENKSKDYSKEKRKDWKAKDVNDLSDEELKKRNNRLQAEQNYKNNMTPQIKKDAKQFAKNTAQEAIKNIFIGTAVTALAAVMAKNYKTVGPIIAKAGKKAINSIKSYRNPIRDSANQYSRRQAPNDGYRMNLMTLDKVHRSDTNRKAKREFNYKPGSNHGFAVARDWPTVNSKGNKSGKKSGRR